MNATHDPDPFADPFAGATPTPIATSGTTAATDHPASTAERLRSAAGTRTNSLNVESDSTERVPCPCVCGCGNLSDKTFADIESAAAARHLRCSFCAAETHFGPRWNPDETAAAGMGLSDERVTGKNGTEFIIRHRHIDPVEEAENREIANRLARERREAARDRWLARLPERWQMPYDDNEDLEPQVEDRLERIGRAEGGHGTSLLCIGPFGSGKTWVAYTYARAAVDRDLLWPQEIHVGTEAEIMEPIALASPWEVAAKSAELLHPGLKLLIIDDVGALGTYKNQENRYATWTKVINWAYEHKRALVLTTNRILGTEDEPPEDIPAAEIAQWRSELLERWIGPTAYERLKHMVGKEQVFRDENKRGEMTARWESEYQQIRKNRRLD